MSPLVQRTLVVFILKASLVRIERREPLGQVVLDLIESLMTCFEDTDEPV